MIFILLIILFVLGAIFSSPKYKGYKGEQKVASYLEKLNTEEYRVINNLLLKTSYGSSQIDHVIVSVYGVFVIETKNYRGWIIGSEYADNWKQVIYKRKETLRNPIKQNYGHIKALKEKLNLHNNIKYISIVAFTNRATLKVNTSSSVIYTRNIINEISKYRDRILSIQEVNSIYQDLLFNNVDSKEMRKEHVNNVRRNVRQKPNNNSNNNNICPRCGGRLLQRKGKNGAFIGCSNFPKCRYTKNIS